jgi:hypothetical protein
MLLCGNVSIISVENSDSNYTHYSHNPSVGEFTKSYIKFCSFARNVISKCLNLSRSVIVDINDATQVRRGNRSITTTTTRNNNIKANIDGNDDNEMECTEEVLITEGCVLDIYFNIPITRSPQFHTRTTNNDDMLVHNKIKYCCTVESDVDDVRISRKMKSNTIKSNESQISNNQSDLEMVLYDVNINCTNSSARVASLQPCCGERSYSSSSDGTTYTTSQCSHYIDCISTVSGGVMPHIRLKGLTPGVATLHITFEDHNTAMSVNAKGHAENKITLTLNVKVLDKYVSYQPPALLELSALLNYSYHGIYDYSHSNVSSQDSSSISTNGLEFMGAQCFLNNVIYAAVYIMQN